MNTCVQAFVCNVHFLLYQAIFRLRFRDPMIILGLTVRATKSLYLNGWQCYKASRTWVLTSHVHTNSCVCLFYYSHSVGVKWYFIVVFTCISLMASGAKHLFMCFCHHFQISLKNCLFRSFAKFLIGLLVEL